MEDMIIRATAADAQIRAFAATTKHLVETARISHNTCPTVTAALGRLLTAGSMMGSMMKGEKDLVTLQIRGDGPVEGLTVTADSQGNVKGYAVVPQVNLPASEKGKLDVGRAVGKGVLSVIRDLGLKEPYAGQTEIQTGEIAEDLAYYFACSEQVPSSVGLGVLMSRENTVREAGGFIIQIMPFAEEETVSHLEENLRKLRPVTSYLQEGMGPQQILETALDGLDLKITDTMQTAFVCSCSREKVERTLISLGKQELKSMIGEGKEITVDCQFCRKKYEFTVENLKELLHNA